MNTTPYTVADGVTLTDAQRAAIATTVEVFNRGGLSAPSEISTAGLDHYHVDPTENPNLFPVGTVAVLFHYRYPDGKDGLGLEVTEFGPDGSVLTSQDLG